MFVLFYSFLEDEKMPERSSNSVRVVFADKDRIPDYLPENLSTGCDVFPYTIEEIERMKQEGMLRIRHVLKESVWL